MKQMIKEGLYQCTPNFSEGRDIKVLDAIRLAIEQCDEVNLLDWSADADHNRSVFTFTGTAYGVKTAALASAAAAIAHIDLRTHSGLHPRTGALDVLPVTPVGSSTREDAVGLIHAIGMELWKQYGLTVYMYGWSARPEGPSELPDWRRLLRAGDPPPPDYGALPCAARSGVVLAAARARLVACNMDLATSDLSIATEIARLIRHSRERVPCLNGVRSLALYLPKRGCTQVSMNLTSPMDGSLPALFNWVNNEAVLRGSSVQETEVIGVLPRILLRGELPESFLWKRCRSAQIVDY